jgi:sRNA-binding protein
MSDKRHKAAVPIIESLCERWPLCFVILQQRRRPLMLRIDQTIAAAAPGVFTPAELESALRFYTGNIGYLRACREGVARIDLLGNVVGVVTKDEAEYAAKIIARRRSKPVALNQTVSGSSPISAPKRISLADLRAAAAARRKVAAS